MLSKRLIHEKEVHAPKALIKEMTLLPSCLKGHPLMKNTYNGELWNCQDRRQFKEALINIVEILLCGRCLEREREREREINVGCQ